MPRSPYPPPAHADKGATVSSDQLIVQFHHPAYYGRLGALPFLVLPAHEQGALHHETARLACALVAGNRVDGYLSTDQKGRQPVGADPDILLNLQEYFFQVPRDQMPGWEETEGSAGYGDIDLEDDYPIFPDFKSWCFERLPRYWKRVLIPALESHSRSPSKTRNDVQLRDNHTCRLSGHAGVNEVAHLIPQAWSSWCLSRGMTQYGKCNGQENALLLRNDLHYAFDDDNFAFVPRNIKSSSVAAREDTETVLVAHIVGTGCRPQVVELYHDVQLQPLHGVRVEFVYCRFALAVLSIVSSRINMNHRRRLVRVSWSDNSYDICEDIHVKDTRSRIPSPKRSAGDAELPGENGSDSTRKRTYLDGNDQIWVWGEGLPSDDFPERGRKRQRSSSSQSCSSLQSRFLDESFTRSTTDDTSRNSQQDADTYDFKRGGIVTHVSGTKIG